MNYGVALYAFSSLFAAAPEEHGPHAIAEVDAGEVSAAGVDIPVVVYRPTDLTSPAPLVIVMHGYTRTGRYQAELGRTFATRGIVAVVPDMPCSVLGGCDHDANAAQLSGLIDWALSSGSGFANELDGVNIGLVGHSWGGLAVFLAATREPRLKSVVCLDPNDDRETAQMVASTAMPPTIHIMAENIGACNGTLWGDSVYPLTPSPHLRVRVVGSGHCDPEEPSDNLCPTLCGSGDRATAPLFRRYAIAWTECLLFGTGGSWISGPDIEADVTAGALDQVDHAGLETLRCLTSEPPPPPLDAGLAIEEDVGIVSEDAAETAGDAAPVSVDATSPDPIDASVTEAKDAGVAAMSPGVLPPAESDDGCRAIAGSTVVSWWILALVLAVTRRLRS